jgi:DNA replication and repair protein RecF
VRIVRVRAVGWRNLEPLDQVWDPRAALNVLYGQNAQGKTNLIEALYFAGTFRSFRTTQPADLIARGASEARLTVEIETRDLRREVEVRLFRERADEAGQGESSDSSPVKRLIALDGKAVGRVSAAFGVVSLVLFVPEDLLLARASPAARRRFADMATAGIATAYLGETVTFQRVLKSRNALLRGGQAGTSPIWLDTLDEQLATAGARLVVRRRAFVNDMAEPSQRFFRALHAEIALELAYESDAAVAEAQSENDVRLALLAGLVKRRAVDLRRRHTTFGPQTDDLIIRLGGRLAREHASQGQLRSIMLALKLSELALLTAARGEAPVLLLDDVPSELDPLRRQFLFDTLSTLGCQTILSVADRAVVPPVAGRVDLEVDAGRIGAPFPAMDPPELGSAARS